MTTAIIAIRTALNFFLLRDVGSIFKKYTAEQSGCDPEVMLCSA